MEKLENIKNTYLCLKLREIKHRFIFQRDYKRMPQAMNRFKKCSNKKSKFQIRKEFNLCKKFWGCYPLHYYRYDLYKKDKKLTKNELLSYIPEFFFYNLFLPFYDSKKFEILLTDKIITEQLFKSVSIPQPKTIFKLIDKHIYSNSLKEIDYSTVENKIKEEKAKKIFVKPTDGQGGFGIYIFKRKNTGQYLTDNNIVFNKNFLVKIGKKNNYLAQFGLMQHKEISKIYPHSINTFRVATENKNSNVRILCSTLRVGIGGKEVDNSAQDGIILKIDIRTGKLGDYATTEQCQYFKKHPDTNFIFKGTKIQNWNKIKNFVEECASKLPQFTYLGWDIALTQNGPVAIETNLDFGLDHYQIPLGGLREIFRINDPKFYWKNLTKLNK